MRIGEEQCVPARFPLVNSLSCPPVYFVETDRVSMSDIAVPLMSVNPPLRRRLLSRGLHIYGRPGAREARGRIISAMIPGRRCALSLLRRQLRQWRRRRRRLCAVSSCSSSLRSPRLRASFLAKHEAAATQDGLN